MVNTYELVLILRSSVGEEQKKSILDEVKKLLTSRSKVADTKDMGKKSLAYPIRKETEGYYWLLILEAEGKDIINLTNKLKHNENILRFLLVKTEKIKSKKIKK